MITGAIKEILGRLEPANWIKCPLCGEEWNKLHPCEYFISPSPEKLLSYVCIRCAEGVRALPQFKINHPIPGVEIKLILRGGYRNDPIAVQELTTAWWAIVQYTPEMMFKIEPQAAGKLKVTYGPESDKPKFYDNIFQVWFSIKAQLENSAKPEKQEIRWGKPKSKHSPKKQLFPDDPDTYGGYEGG